MKRIYLWSVKWRNKRRELEGDEGERAGVSPNSIREVINCPIKV